MSWIQLLAAAILGGGLASGVASILNVRTEARKVRIQEQEYRDNLDIHGDQRTAIVVEAAERSVTMLNVALSRAEREIKDLEATIGRLSEELVALKEKYTDLQVTLIQMRQRAKDLTGEDD